MTNLEAIDRINRHITLHHYNEPHAVYITEALKMAVKALGEQVPVAPVEDGEGCLICGNQGFGCGVVGKYDVDTHEVLERYVNYCPSCGKEVMWNG